MFFEIIIPQHSICIRSCCIRTLVFLFFLEGGIVREVGESGRGSCKIDKSVRNQCLMQTSAYHAPDDAGNVGPTWRKVTSISQL